jgi:GNAT superfamily N-acetyltransferase
MHTDIRIRAVAPRQRDLLFAMYDRFDPLGGAFGLPPPVAEMRRSWIGHALGQKVNVAAFSTEGRIVGHCFLAADDSASAELAVFVDQKCRGQGIGMELVKAALNWAAAVGVRRVWSVTPSENKVAVGMQQRLGFRAARVSTETEMEIYLPACARV